MELQYRIEKLEDLAREHEDIIADHQGLLEDILGELKNLYEKRQDEWKEEDRVRDLEYSRSRF